MTSMVMRLREGEGFIRSIASFSRVDGSFCIVLRVWLFRLYHLENTIRHSLSSPYSVGLPCHYEDGIPTVQSTITKLQERLIVCISGNSCCASVLLNREET